MATTHYNLRQWGMKDRPDRQGLNENFQTIDTALGQKANQSDLSANISSVQSSVNNQLSSITSAISSLQSRLEVRVGSYVGDGTVNRTVIIGFTPEGVFVEHSGGQRLSSGTRYGGLALWNKPCQGYNNNVVEATIAGFVVTKEGSTSSNEKDTVYYYVAFK